MKNPLKIVFTLVLVVSQIAAHSQLSDDAVDLLREANGESGREKIALLNEFLDLHGRGDSVHTVIIAEVENWSMSKGDSNERIEFLLRKADYLNKIGSNRQSLEITHHLLQNAPLTPKQEFRALFTQRATYLALGLFDRAIAIHTALNWNNSHETWESTVPDNFLAFTYYKLGETKLAIQTLKKCLQTVDMQDYAYWEMSFTNSMGVMFESLGELDSAWHYYHRAKQLLLENFEPGKDLEAGYYQFTLGLFNGNIAQILAARGEHLQAIPLYKQDIESSLQHPLTIEYRRNAITSMIKLANSYCATNQFSNAKKSLAQANSLLHGFALSEERQKYLKSMLSLYDMESKSDSALSYAKRYIEFKDSLDRVNNIQRSQNLQIAYESGLKERELQAQKSELENLKEKDEQERLIQYMVYFMAVLLIAVIIIMYRAYRKRLLQQRELFQKSKQIEDQSETINRSLHEKDILLREVHHRVKNNLQIISSLFFLQSKKLKDESARSILREGQSRVHVMSLIHQKLYQSNNLKTVDLHSYLTELSRQIIQTNQKNDLQIDLTIEGKGIEQSVDKAVPIGMIVNELITNSINHAFVGRKMGQIRISLLGRGHLVRLEYEDDGRGIDSFANLEKEDSLGMKLIRLLSSQLDGALEFDTTSGFKISIEFEADKVGVDH
ncbi:MAG: sensor histidine kinase [Flavobacteriales bacterium]